ncbi:daf-12-interacting protein 1-like [Artemia franciscana]|uniref:daf-12-interacting protein 1-like n=1 Tax=Artemia franciscana TaxID=6661 RepID=UPI0032DB8E27
MSVGQTSAKKPGTKSTDPLTSISGQVHAASSSHRTLHPEKTIDKGNRTDSGTLFNEEDEIQSLDVFSSVDILPHDKQYQHHSDHEDFLVGSSAEEVKEAENEDNHSSKRRKYRTSPSSPDVSLKVQRLKTNETYKFDTDKIRKKWDKQIYPEELDMLLVSEQKKRKIEMRKIPAAEISSKKYGDRPSETKAQLHREKESKRTDWNNNNSSKSKKLSLGIRRKSENSKGRNSPVLSSKKGSKENIKNNDGQKTLTHFDLILSPDLEKSMPPKHEKLCPSQQKTEFRHNNEESKKALGYSSPPSRSSSRNSNSNSSHHQGQCTLFDTAPSPSSNKSNSQKSENLKFIPTNNEKLHPSNGKARLQHTVQKRKEAHGCSSPQSRSSSKHSKSNNCHHQGQYALSDLAHSPASNKSNSQESENLEFMPTNNEKLYPSKQKTELQHTEDKPLEAHGYSSPRSRSSSRNSNSTSSHHQGQCTSPSSNKSNSQKSENLKFIPTNNEKLHPSKRKEELQNIEEKSKEAHGYSSPPSRSSSKNSNSNSSHHQGQYASFDSDHSPTLNKSNSQRSESLCTPTGKVVLRHEKSKKIYGFSSPYFEDSGQSRNSNSNNHEGQCMSFESVLTQISENSTPKQSKKLHPAKLKKGLSHSEAKPNKIEEVSLSEFEHRIKDKLGASHRHRGHPTSAEKSAANRRENSRRPELETDFDHHKKILKSTVDPKIPLKSPCKENGKQDKETSQVEKEFHVSKKTFEKGSSKDAPVAASSQKKDVGLAKGDVGDRSKIKGKKLTLLPKGPADDDILFYFRHPNPSRNIRARIFLTEEVEEMQKRNSINIISQNSKGAKAPETENRTLAADMQNKQVLRGEVVTSSESIPKAANANVKNTTASVMREVPRDGTGTKIPTGEHVAEPLHLLKNTETHFVPASRLQSLDATSEEMTRAPKEIGRNEASRVLFPETDNPKDVSIPDKFQVANLRHLNLVSEETISEDYECDLGSGLTPPISDSEVSVANRDVVLIDLVEDELSDSNLTAPFRSPGNGVEPSSDVSLHPDFNLTEGSLGDVDVCATHMVQIPTDILRRLEEDDVPLATGSVFWPPADFFSEEMASNLAGIEENGSRCVLAPDADNSSGTCIQGRVLALGSEESLGKDNKCHLETYSSRFNSTVPDANKDVEIVDLAESETEDVVSDGASIVPGRSSLPIMTVNSNSSSSSQFSLSAEPLTDPDLSFNVSCSDDEPEQNAIRSRPRPLCKYSAEERKKRWEDY